MNLSVFIASAAKAQSDWGCNVEWSSAVDWSSEVDWDSSMGVTIVDTIADDPTEVDPIEVDPTELNSIAPDATREDLTSGSGIDNNFLKSPSFFSIC